MNNIFRNKQQILAEAKAKEEAQAVRKNFGGKIGDTHLEITLRVDIPDEMVNMSKLLVEVIDDIKIQLSKLNPPK